MTTLNNNSLQFRSIQLVEKRFCLGCKYRHSEVNVIDNLCDLESSITAIFFEKQFF